jgi:hypothetical protein
MSLFIAAMALALQPAQQTEPPRPELPIVAELPPPRELTPAHDLFFEDFSAMPPEARIAAQSFGECIAERSPELSRRTLLQDARGRAYASGLRHLARANQSCFRGRYMRSANLLVAGGMAERLVERSGQPVNVVLTRTAALPAQDPRTPAEAIALCVVRSVPDEIGRLLATEVGSDGENAALRSLEPVVQLCNRTGRRLEITNAGVRAILATAAHRVIAASASATN